MLTAFVITYVHFASSLRDDDGATAVEYALLAAGIAMVIAFSVYEIGRTLVPLYADVIEWL